MSTRNTIITGSILIAISILAGLLLWNQLPDPMASHWAFNDQVNGTMDKLWGVLMMPLLCAGLFLLLMAVPSIDPLKANIAQFRSTFNIFVVMMLGFMLYVYGVTLAWNLGYTSFRMSTAMLPALGLLFLLLGFLIEKAKRNFFIGIRTPWTLSSDNVWNETHRVGGMLFKLSGLLAFVGIILPAYAFWFLLVPLIGSTLFLVIYSYVLYQRETQTQNG